MIHRLHSSSFSYSPLVPLQVEPLKDIVVVFDLALSPNISFHPSTTTDLYRVSGFQAFAKYFDNLFHRPHREITIIIVGCNLRQILSTLSLLYWIFSSTSTSTTDSPTTTPYQVKFTDAYRYYIRQTHSSNAASTVTPAIGEHDRPVPFNLVFIMNLAELSDAATQASSTMAQQLVRFLALKHGGLVILTSHVDRLLANPESILSFKPEPKPVFHLNQHLGSEEYACHLYIPLAWDSWSKIIILGKSAPSHHTRWDSSEVLLQVNSEYNEILDSPGVLAYPGLFGEIVAADSELHVPHPDFTELSLNDILCDAIDK